MTVKNNRPTVMMRSAQSSSYLAKTNQFFVNRSSAHPQPTSSDSFRSSQLKSNGEVHNPSRPWLNDRLPSNYQADHSGEIEEKLTENDIKIKEVRPNVDSLLPNRKIYRKLRTQKHHRQPPINLDCASHPI